MPKTGRPPAWLVGEGDLRLPIVEPAVVGQRLRLTLPLYGRLAVSWLSNDKATEVLLVLEQLGRITILPRSPHADPILQRIAELGAQEPLSAEEREEIIQLRSRYFLARIDRGGRFVLPPLAAAHLQLSASKGAQVFVAFFDEVIEIWTQTYRLERMAAFTDEGGTLP